ncbi:MAG TPA: hypothetical protein VKM55_19665 [Candidatus Lokiarchaeia archaeon]|nr:hypothetical protein [Candidatus Lokiarchaeia archaeon]
MLNHEGTRITARAGESTAAWHDIAMSGSRKCSLAAVAQPSFEEKNYPQRYL